MHCEEKTTKVLFTMIQHWVFFVSSYFQLFMRSKCFNQRGILAMLYMKLKFEYHSASKASLKNNPTDVMVM